MRRLVPAVGVLAALVVGYGLAPAPATAACLVSSEFRWDRPFVRDAARAAELIAVAEVADIQQSTATLAVERVLKGQAGQDIEVPSRILNDCVQGSAQVGQRLVYFRVGEYEGAPPEFVFQETRGGRFAFQFYSFATLGRLIGAMALLPDTATAEAMPPVGPSAAPAVGLALLASIWWGWRLSQRLARSCPEKPG